MIPYSRQDIDQADIDAVVRVLKSDFITQGPVLPVFEKEFSSLVKAQFGVGVNSATSALHLACLSLGLNSGDRLWTSPNTFVASANCALYCGASVDLVDIDPNTFNMCPHALEEKLEREEKTERLPKIVIPVHFAGRPCEMKKIWELSKKFGFRVIEDASHALGSSREGTVVGSCEYSDITVFSFHAIKLITSGEGGIAVTNDEGLAKKLARLRSHGITRQKPEMEQPDQGNWYYEQIDLGYNYRMSDIAATLGLSQLSKIEKFLDKRRKIAKGYSDSLGRLPLVLPLNEANVRSAWHLYVVRVDPSQSKLSRDNVFDLLRENGIGVNVHYIPIHMQPYYQKMGFQLGDFPVAEKYSKEALSLPIFPSLTFEEQAKVSSTLLRIFS